VYNTPFEYGYNSPLEQARELFKPSEDSWRLVVQTAKKILAWDLVFFVDYLHNERMFMHICLHLDDDVILWESNNRADFVAQSFFGF